MKMINENHRNIVNILSFSLIPLSAFATDIYLPSLPSMATQLHASPTQVQLSLLLFMVSAGVSQLFVGSLLDSFGRYKLSNAALLIFSLSSFAIALFPNLYLLFCMRVVQGITAAFILVSKRAYFMDTYSGNELKHYTSLFSIIWAVAPIIAPFIGGYLQHAFGWQANFYVLGSLTFIILLLTIKYGGETIKNRQPLQLGPLLKTYSSILATKDFAFALIILGLSFGMVMLFGMVSPFMIEHVWHRTPMTTGYCALLSGVAMMTGGIVSKLIITRPLEKKMPVALGIQLASGVLATIISMLGEANMYMIMCLVVIQHAIVGFVFNNFFAYCLGRFSRNAGVVAGMSGGAFYIISSLSSYGMASILVIKNQGGMVMAYLFLNLFVVLVYSFFRREEMAATKKLQYKLSLNE